LKASKTLLVATRNPGKCRELQQILSHLPLVLMDLSHFPNAREIKETGNTFIENAGLKAAGYATQTGLLTLADDSGLEIDALDGAPGIWSARYMGESVSFDVRIQSLLKRMSDIESSRRTARFVCAIAIADHKSKILSTSVGTCEGKIASEPRGAFGFGYDPIFIPTGYRCTLGELRPDIKNQISHRAKALRKTQAFLQSLTGRVGAD
jgi:XTP/dITP diphosphohydrolase